ncbi:histidine phosphatase family protein [Mycobacterium pseudokansasii]|uniref:Phosphoserine phosphatase 1 n=1 Tax=Mycobacterium pseudokansasii TaxID=2341080 RepID=A0A498QY98_9MYCO|nr:histidine phosphatase family protein [Mycobacterium pseudokansasii]KZS69670.1 histidine phosphatase [Mycobacterium kansasii]VBA32905.1 Phosphoserine phosphatase 1 [Mycobacterium pseudokansasii]VBA34509.1 Phosphoserine phosphatase 1 [Mycobacterium pseudokansasii]VBA55840.1 Phosphoserine phosphatase 1 [Mycobacterium pseudokansasii]
MSHVARLTLVSHAMTDAMAVGRFPADEPLDDIGRRQAEAAARLDIGHVTQLAAPEQRAVQTAELLGLQAATDPRLTDLDCGRWRGTTLENVDHHDLRAWLTDPAQAPHGGESVVDLIGRVAGWLQSLTDNTVAVTHPAVIRAAILVALDGPPKSFWRIDIAPVGRTIMHLRGHRWTLRL